MPLDSLYTFLTDHVSIEDHPQFASWPVEKKILHICAEFFTTLDRHYDALATLDKADDAEIKLALDKFMQRYVAPLTKTGRPVVDMATEFMLNQAPARLTEVLASAIQGRMGS